MPNLAVKPVDETDIAFAALEAMQHATDETLHRHEVNVGLVTHLLATALGLGEATAAEMSYAGTMHDIGRRVMSEELFSKDGPLSRQDAAEIRRHTGHGALLLERSGFDPDGAAVQAALFHHERYDGTGYPIGLAGETIPLVARIVAVADVYDSIRAARPYKPAIDHDTACRIILDGDDRCRPDHFDPVVLTAFRNNAEAIRRVWEPAPQG